jgi:hypothetical protein
MLVRDKNDESETCWRIYLVQFEGASEILVDIILLSLLLAKMSTHENGGNWAYEELIMTMALKQLHRIIF